MSFKIDTRRKRMLITAVLILVGWDLLIREIMNIDFLSLREITVFNMGFSVMNIIAALALIGAYWMYTNNA